MTRHLRRNRPAFSSRWKRRRSASGQILLALPGGPCCDAGWLGGCAIGCPARSQDGKLNKNLAQQLLQLRPECRRDVLARQREGGIGGEETEAGAAIIGDAIEAHAMKTVFLSEGEHRIRQLDFAAGAFFALLQDGENFRFENVAP